MPGSNRQKRVNLLGYVTLARSWLPSLLVLPALALAPSGCLVTESPAFVEPRDVAPKIIPRNPQPSVVIRALPQKGGADQYDVKAFEFDVLSEEANKNEHVFTVLLINYGQKNVQGDPYGTPIAGIPVEPGTLDDGPRVAQPIKWVTPKSVYDPDTNSGTNCYTATLLATHQFRSRGPGFFCPGSLDDSDTVTWTVYFCNSADCSPKNCPVNGTTFCDTPG